MTSRMRSAATILALLLLTGLLASCSGSAGAAGKDAPESTSATATTTTVANSTTAVPSSTTAPEPTSAAPESQPVEGTSWAGTDSDGDAYVYRFLPSGQFGFTSPTGTYADPDDTWTQEGTQVTMKTSGGYATYLGTVQGTTISGTASNVTGRTWTWTAQRQ